MKEWWTPAELAELQLPGMPTRREHIARLADESGWRDPAREFPRAPDGIWRRREGRGGGFEYRYDVLPDAAKVRLVARQRRAAKTDARANAKATVSRDGLWEWFDALPDTRKAEANTRLAALNAVEDLVLAGSPRDLAMVKVSAEHTIALRTLYNWASLVHGLARADWLPSLAPRYAGRQVTAEYDEAAWDFFASNYLRQSQPSAAKCYRDLQAVADEKGWSIPSRKTLERRLAKLDTTKKTFLRQGEEALKRQFPAQQRDRSTLHALQAVNADGHTWDVWVKFPDGTVTRPAMVAFQDLHSGKILSWRVDTSENRDAVRLAFADLVETYGIPEEVLLDNGRAFASKRITGGAPNRFRFKVQEEEPEGILTALGCRIHWATPYHGQAKPIERAFRDLANNIARDAAFEGAWTGNTVANKPENYGTRSVPLADFLAVVSRGINEHNARTGRRTLTCRGELSFDQAFDASYSEAAIQKAAPAQLRKLLLASELVSARQPDGAVYLADNRYWAEFLVNHIGRKVVLRFDPDALHDRVHVYRPDGAYLGEAPCVAAVGFFSTDAARAQARARAEFLRGARMQARAERKLSAAEVAAMAPKIEAPEPPESKVVRPFFPTIGNTAVAAAAASNLDHDEDSVLLSFGRAVEQLREERGLRLIEKDDDAGG